MKMKINPQEFKHKMDSEELQSYLKIKKSGNGAHKSKKAYDRKKSKKINQF